MTQERRGGGGKTGNAGNGEGIFYVGREAWCTDDELDVRWYLCDAPGLAAGMKSNMGVQLDALKLGFSRQEATYVDPDEAMVERLHDARRARRVWGLLSAVGEAHREVLSAVFGGESPPKAVRDRWGARGSVVLLLEPQAARRTKGPRAVELDRAAEKRLTAAQTAYARARAESRHA